MGHTHYDCVNCDYEFDADYTDKIPHDYKAEITAPSCSAFGFTVFTCACGDTYTGDYTDKTEHNYNKQVVEPTCEEHGYAVYECPDCGASYIGDYTENIEHKYTAVVTAPTCTELGYTTYTCECGDSYKSDYVKANGHTPSDWIIDVPATIEQDGSKHIECEICKTVLKTEVIPQLIDADRTDEDGNAEIGDFSILLTDEKGLPIFDSEISIDKDNNITIKLPSGKLLDFEDRTKITVFFTETQEPATDLNIFISDNNGNNATGVTDANGQLSVPNDKSSTGDTNGTIGKEDGEVKTTLVVSVTDKYNVIISDCDIHIGESNNVVIDLPAGIKPTRENPVIITVTDENGVPHKDITVIAIGEADYIEKGITDYNGKLTLPTANEGYTDNDGKVNVENVNVIVNDETGVIVNAYVKYNEDGTISVLLPEDKTINHANRITVTVLDSIGAAVKDKTVTVNDITEKSYTAVTDENGKIVVPPVSEDYSDKDGKAAVNGYSVLIADETKPIENAFVEIIDGKLSVKLPESSLIDINNKISVTVTGSENAPVKDMSVTVVDVTENGA